ncbi:hypothetical protein A1Q1_01361 [Trichosporon asahii var. asahii CBS 2479]|uniref:Uncharacterized protein n=1 Tax=Trichosporon asahii var. asahii (strain ATCC 90039 / CBS 2479 / JCM 2466 / KCTC 7840 / NBRC 103889/ NCYC 2677 / UAMH 7654) TaxID=1186058 RepID=J6F2N9_TRIAS|nr:hypothetical protein A1Q1_01361 [Trichosporon asahii var. asahii CBS 2479]EJT49457.1 hypothetical protein A1Q1_01361 [Trichosporon asahii var. asahii CBS 2479]
MAQGAGKLKAAKTSGGRKNTGLTKKGKRNCAPKKAMASKEYMTKKALSTKINANIERQMVNAASAGKLTIMKDKGGDDPKTAAKKAKEAKK